MVLYGSEYIATHARPCPRKDLVVDLRWGPLIDKENQCTDDLACFDPQRGRHE